MVEDFGILGLIEILFSLEELFMRKKESIKVLFGDQNVHFLRYPTWLFTLVTAVRNFNRAKKTILNLF